MSQSCDCENVCGFEPLATVGSPACFIGHGHEIPRLGAKGPWRSWSYRANPMAAGRVGWPAVSARSAAPAEAGAHHVRPMAIRRRSGAVRALHLVRECRRVRAGRGVHGPESLNARQGEGAILAGYHRDSMASVGTFCASKLTRGAHQFSPMACTRPIWCWLPLWD